MLVLELLGTLSLRDETRPVPVSAQQKRLLGLLAILAVAGKQGMSRDRIETYLWPESTGDNARHSLDQTVYSIRNTLGPDFLISTGRELRLNPQFVQVDVWEFEEAIRAGRHTAAVGIYKGPLLDGVHLADSRDLESWIDTNRSRLRFEYQTAIEQLAKVAADAGDHTKCVTWLRQLVNSDPLSSGATKKLMLALAAAGDRAAAVKHARLYQELVKQELEIEPDSEIESLAASLSKPAAVEATAPPVRAATSENRAAPPDATSTIAASGHAVRSTLAPPTRRVRRVVTVLLVAVAAVGGLLWRQATTPQAGRNASRFETPVRRYSLAVLPLKNYSGDPAQEDFAAGMTDELTTTLSKIEGLHVIAHQSVRQFKRSDRTVPEIARSLGVGYVVDGSVVQEGDRVRIIATLIDAATNAPVWAERFERDRRDVLALQRELALAIARAVEVALTPQDRARLAETPAVDPEAFELYVRGEQARYRTGPEDFAKAVNYFTRAIGQDSTYAPAYAGLGFVYAVTADEARARQFADKALSLDPRLPEAHMVLGMVRHFSDWDWAGSESAFREAIRLNPGYAEAHHELSMLLMRRQRFDEALREARRALYLAPMSSRYENGVGEVYLYSGRYDEALELANKALAVDSINAAWYALKAYAYGEQQRYDKAAEAATKCIALGWDVHGRALLGYVYAKSGRRVEALKIVDTLTARWRDRTGELRVPFSATAIAVVYSGLGDRARALDWLERAVGTDLYVGYLGIDPAFRSLHAEPRFRTLLKAVGLEK